MSRHRYASGARTAVQPVPEGEAIRVTDRGSPETLPTLYRVSGWPATVGSDAFTAPYGMPSAGPPLWRPYRFMVHTAIGAVPAEPSSAAR